jgi:hypothetical protein
VFLKRDVYRALGLEASLLFIRHDEPPPKVGPRRVFAATEQCAAHEARYIADLIELLGRHSGLSATDPRRETLELARPIGQMVSPLSMQPNVPARGRFIYAGVADRIVHPRKQVLTLWEHWGKPDIGWYHGGHTGFFEARPVQRYIDAAVVQSGLVDTTGSEPGDDKPTKK